MGLRLGLQESEVKEKETLERTVGGAQLSRGHLGSTCFMTGWRACHSGLEGADAKDTDLSVSTWICPLKSLVRTTILGHREHPDSGGGVCILGKPWNGVGGPGVCNWHPSPCSTEFPQGARSDLLTYDWEACHRKLKARLYRVACLKMTSAPSWGVLRIFNFCH